MDFEVVVVGLVGGLVDSHGFDCCQELDSPLLMQDDDECVMLV